MKFRKMWNPDAIFRIYVYLLMIAGLGYGLYSRRLLRYVAPRSIKYVVFMITVLTLLFVMEFRNVRCIREKKMRSLDYLFFLIPLLLAFTTAPTVVKGSALKTTASQIRRNMVKEKEEEPPLKTEEEPSVKAEEEKPLISSRSTPEMTNETKATTDTTDELKSKAKSETTSTPEVQSTPEEVPNFSSPVDSGSQGSDENGDKTYEGIDPIPETPIVPPKDGELKEVDESNYFAVMMSIEEEGDKWNGKKIEISGFVYRDETLSKRQFLLVRMLMKCCAADMEPLVLLSVLPEGMEMPKNDEWFVVRGTLRTKPIVETGLWVPTLEVELMAPISEPEKSYVDPIYNG